MDISAHKKTYAAFLTGSKWVFGFVILLMIFLAIFRTQLTVRSHAACGPEGKPGGRDARRRDP